MSTPDKVKRTLLQETASNRLKIQKLEEIVARIENRLETVVERVNLILTRLQVPEYYKIPEEE